MILGQNDKHFKVLILSRKSLSLFFDSDFDSDRDPDGDSDEGALTRTQFALSPASHLRVSEPP